MPADFGVTITQGILVALAKHCKDACAAAKRYPEEAARIRLRLTYLLSRVPEWSNRIERTYDDDKIDVDDDDPVSAQLGKSLYDSLSDLALCVQALGSSNDRSWRKKLRIFLQGKTLLDKLNEAETKFNQVLDDLNHDSTNFIASHIPTIHEQLCRVNNMEEKISCMLSLFKQFDQLPAGNRSNPKATLNDAIQETLDVFHKKDSIMDSHNSTDTVSTVDTTGDAITIDYKDVVFDTSLETRLGKGGFAEVFKGKFHDEDVAVKVIDIYRNYDRLNEMPLVIYEVECNRVQDEAIIMKQCSVHSNVVDVFGYCPPNKFAAKPLIVMELMHTSLNKVLHQSKDLVLSYSTRLQLMKDIANAIEFLHLQGIVHQDVKASNILVDENITIAKLTDFGVAECKGFKTTWAQRHTTSLATIMKNSNKHAAGTLAYQAPELVLKQLTIASRSAEIYSFGVTMWECLSRTIPHDNKENEILSLAQNKSEMMLPFPVKDVIGDIDILPNECDSFSLLEQVSFVCTSKSPTSRPTATYVVQYLDNVCTIKEMLPLESLSHWLVDVDDVIDMVTYPQKGVGNIVIKEVDSIQFPDDSKSKIVTVPTNRMPVQVPSNSTKMDVANSVLPLHNQQATTNVSNSINRTGVNNVAASHGKPNNSKMCKLGAGVVVVVVTIIAVVVYLVTKQTDPTSNPIVPTSSPIVSPIAPNSSPVKVPAMKTSSPTAVPARSPIVSPTKPAAITTSSPTPLPTSFPPPVAPSPSPSASPTISPLATAIPIGCFQESSELRSSVIAYINGETSVYAQYGTLIGDWCVDSIEDFSSLFQSDTSTLSDFFSTFNDDISRWNTSSAKNMAYMFAGANGFDQDLSSWDVSSVTDMSGMFNDANKFNHDLSSWDVSSVTNMSYMFAADAFNQDLSRWDVSLVTDMSGMFYGANAFNQDLCSWGDKLNVNTAVTFMFAVGSDTSTSSCPDTNDPVLADVLTKGPFCYQC